jgi:ubiquinone/menaquinone biosynthesis C-methylase UbiE
MQLLSYRLAAESSRPTTTELAARYDRAAARWPAKIRRLGFDRAYRALFAQLRQEGVLDGLGPETAVLDAGIGTGAFALALHEVWSTGWRLHGVDISAAMLAQARRTSAGRNLPFVPHLGSICRLPFADNAFHLVLAAHTLEHLSPPCAGLAEMARVARPGAPLVVVVTQAGRLSKLVDVRWGLDRLSAGQLRQTMAQAGLRQVHLYELGGPPWCRCLSLAAVGWK